MRSGQTRTPPGRVAGVGWPSGSGEWCRCAQLRGAGVSRRRGGALGPRGPAARCAPRRLRGRPPRAARGGPPPRGCAGLRARRGAQPSQRGRALGPARHRPGAHRRHRARDPARRPGDPPAPLSLPRCPGHHQPRGHPDHHDRPHPARSRRHRQEPSSSSGRWRRPCTCAIYDHRAITDVIAQQQRTPRNTAILTRATRRAQGSRAAHGRTACSGWSEAPAPGADVNEPFHAPDHGPCKPDFHWPGHDLIVETDGWDSHSTRAAFEDDRAKDAALTAAGYRVVRFTWLTEDATIASRASARCCQRLGLAR